LAQWDVHESYPWIQRKLMIDDYAPESWEVPLDTAVDKTRGLTPPRPSVKEVVPPKSPRLLPPRFDTYGKPTFKTPNDNWFIRVANMSAARDLRGQSSLLGSPRGAYNRYRQGTEEVPTTVDPSFDIKEALASLSEAEIAIYENNGVTLDDLTRGIGSRTAFDIRLRNLATLIRLEQSDSQVERNWFGNVVNFLGTSVLDITSDPATIPLAFATGGVATGIMRGAAGVGTRTTFAVLGAGEGAAAGVRSVSQQAEQMAELTGDLSYLEGNEGSMAMGGLFGAAFGGSIGAVLGKNVMKMDPDFRAAASRDLVDNATGADVTLGPRGTWDPEALKYATNEDIATVAIRRLAKNDSDVNEKLPDLLDPDTRVDAGVSAQDLFVWLKSGKRTAGQITDSLRKRKPDADDPIERVEGLVTRLDDEGASTMDDILDVMQGEAWGADRARDSFRQAVRADDGSILDAAKREMKTDEVVPENFGFDDLTPGPEGAARAVDLMERNASDGVVAMTKQQIYQTLDNLGIGKAVDFLGRGGTGAFEAFSSTMGKRFPVLAQLASMVDPAGQTMVGDLVDRTGRRAVFSMTGTRQFAMALAEPVVMLMRENAKHLKTNPLTMRALRANRISGESFNDPIHEEIASQIYKIWDRVGLSIKATGGSTEVKYVPGGINTMVVGRDPIKWSRRLSDIWQYKWAGDFARESGDDINVGLASRTIASIDSETGKLVFDDGRVAKTLDDLTDSQFEKYKAGAKAYFDQEANDAIRRALGQEVTEAVDEAGTRTKVRGGRRIDHRQARGFDNETLLHPELAEMFEENPSAFMATYAQSQMAEFFFDEALSKAYGKNVRFENLLMEMRQRLTQGLSKEEADLVSKILKKVEEKKNWAAGRSQIPNEVEHRLMQATVGAGVRTARSLYSGAWGMASGLNELPRAIFMASGRDPGTTGQSLLRLFKSIKGKNRRDLMNGLGYTLSTMGVSFRKMHLAGDMMTGELRLGLAERVGGAWKDFSRIVSGQVRDAYGQSLGRTGDSILGGLDAFAEMGQSFGGLQYVTDIACSVQVNSLMGWLTRNAGKLDTLSTLLSQQKGQVDEKLFKQLCREAKLGGEWRLAAKANKVGILDGKSLGIVQGGKKNKFGFVDLEELRRVILNSEDAAGAEKAYIGINEFIREGLQEAAPAPTAFTTNTSSSLVWNLVDLFSSFPRAFYARNGPNSSATTPQYLASLGIFFMGETAYASWRKLTYGGESFDTVLGEWEENPADMALNSISRIPLMGVASGPVGQLTRLITGGGSGRVPNIVGSSPGTRATQDLMTMLWSLRDGDLSPKEQGTALKASGVGGAWWIWSALAGADLTPTKKDN
jgi:hypothetical protein